MCPAFLAVIVCLTTAHAASSEFLNFTVGQNGNFKYSEYVTASDHDYDPSTGKFTFYTQVNCNIIGNCVNPQLSIEFMDLIYASHSTSSLYSPLSVFINDDYISDCTNDESPDVCTYELMNCNNITQYSLSNYYNDSLSVNNFNISLNVSYDLDYICFYDNIYGIYSLITIECDNTNDIATPGPTTAPVWSSTCDENAPVIETFVVYGSTSSISEIPWWELIKTNELVAVDDFVTDDEEVLVSSNDFGEFGTNQKDRRYICLDYDDINSSCIVFNFYTGWPNYGLECADCPITPYFELYLLKNSDLQLGINDKKTPITLRKQSFTDSQLTIGFCMDFLITSDSKDDDAIIANSNTLDIELDYETMVEIIKTNNSEMVYQNDIRELSFDVDGASNNSILSIRDGCYQIIFDSEDGGETS